MCAKLRTVAASNYRDHPSGRTINCSPGSQALLVVTHQDRSIGITLLLLVRTTHIYFCSSRTSRSWWITQSTQRHRRGCNSIPSFLQRTTPIARSFVWRLNSARPPHPGHSTILLRSEIPSGMCAKLRTVAASNNRDHPTISLSSSRSGRTINCSPGSQALLEVTHHDHSIWVTLLLLVRTTHIYFCSSRTSVVNHTINVTPPERLQHYQCALMEDLLRIFSFGHHSRQSSE